MNILKKVIMNKKFKILSLLFLLSTYPSSIFCQSEQSIQSKITHEDIDSEKEKAEVKENIATLLKTRNGDYLNLKGANLQKQDFGAKSIFEPNERGSISSCSWTNLSEANLSEANLSQSNLTKAILRNTDFTKANLSGANLSRANLNNAYLLGANLENTNFSEADLSGSNLSNTDLSKAKNLTDEQLQKAKLCNTKVKTKNFFLAYLGYTEILNRDCSTK